MCCINAGGANGRKYPTCVKVSPMFLPTFFSLRTLEKSFLHILLVGEDGNVADSSDNVTRNTCTYEFEKFKIEDGSNRPSKFCSHYIYKFYCLPFETNTLKYSWKHYLKNRLHYFLLQQVKYVENSSQVFSMRKKWEETWEKHGRNFHACGMLSSVCTSCNVFILLFSFHTH